MSLVITMFASKWLISDTLMCDKMFCEIAFKISSVLTKVALK